jgi:predicted membrane-bound spermidine synthase
MSKLELFLLSVASLFFELLAIRWMSSDLRIFSIFRTFPLIACYVGLGFGFSMKGSRLYKGVIFFLAAFVGIMIAADHLGLGYWSFPSLSVFQFQQMADPRTWNLALLIPLLLLLLAAPFTVCAAMGVRLAELFDEIEPLHAYAVNLAGAIAGSLIFTGISFMSEPPAVFVGCISIVLVALFVINKTRPPFAIPGLALAVILPVVVAVTPPGPQKVFFGLPTASRSIVWSPYQRLELHKIVTDKTAEPAGLCLDVNRLFYQFYLRENSKWSDPHTEKLIQDRIVSYSVPYLLGAHDDVLVVGAGSGQDVASAVRYGAKSVDAVEIDPKILQFGKENNPAYSAPNVHPIIDDARHFLNKTDKKYDLIVFGLLDSQAVTGQGSSVRLDSYVYTKESIQSALQHLKPNGLIVLSFAVPSIKDRMQATMRAAAGYEPLVVSNPTLRTWGGTDIFYILGKAVQDKAIVLPNGWQTVTQAGPEESTRVLTDDWPYLYVDTKMVDLPYWGVVLLIIFIILLALRKPLSTKPGPLMWQMFFLGAGFMLLELQAIARLSLVFGSTWLTSSIVINGILIMLLGANLLVLRFRERILASQYVIYAGLLVTLAASYAVPTSLLAQATGDLLLSTTVVIISLLPLLMAGLIFPAALSRAESPSKALTFNFLGAVFGGLLEYGSNFWGILSLVLVAAVLYAISLLFMRAVPAKVSE